MVTGQFEDNLFHGTGKLRLPNGLQYEGEWNYGSKHGQGFLRYASGATYQGDWDEDTVCNIVLLSLQFSITFL